MQSTINFGYLIFLSVVAALGGFLFGYDTAVISGTIAQVTQLFQLDALQQGWYVGCALVGSIIGVLFAGILSDKLGRKLTMVISAILFSASALGCALCTDFTQLVVYRIIGGVGIGVVSIVSPLYISEVSVAQYRGRLVSLYQLAVTVGFLGAYLVNYQLLAWSESGALLGAPLLNKIFITEVWRGMLGMETLPAILFFIIIFFIPESPRWLASSGKREAALKVFTRMGGKEYAVTELAAIEAASACQTQEGGFRQLLNPAMYKVLTIGVVMAILQQWCGINVIFNYAQEIFMAAGYGVSDVLMNIVVTGITNVIFTILAMFVVDRWGRKALTLIGSFGLAIIYSFMGAAYYFHITGIVLLIIVVMAIACYAMTLATVMWVIISEIFPNRIRGVAMSVCTFALWAACFILTYTFPMLNSGLGAAGTFWLYGLICLGGGIFVVFRLPETKGKSLEEIEKELVK